MDKLKKYTLITIFFVVLVCTTFFLVSDNNKRNPEKYINNVLKTRSYAYLPDQAKEFVAEAYKATGEVVLTEKNKIDGQPYLNPEYVKYLELSEEEKENIEVVPNTYVVEAKVELDGAVTVPSSFDLRNYNGYSYITPLKAQGGLGICWAFTSIEHAESFLMLRGNNPGSTKQFSVRQLDYATAEYSTANHTNEHGLHDLGGAGNFLYASYAMANGLTLIDNNLWPFNENMYSMNYHEVFNYSKSEYELNSSVEVPKLNIQSLDLSNSNDIKARDNYLTFVKSYIQTFGGAYVGTDSPTGNCGAYYNGSYIIRLDSKCTANEPHAMQIIGWDDNYTYKYCTTGGKHSTYTTSCPASDTVSGKGAWLLRNSWGSAASYIWLSYDSNNSDIGFITGMSSMANKNWDNNYHTSLRYNDGFYTSANASQSYTKETSMNETLKKVKFYAYGANGTYTIRVCTNGTNQCTDFSSVNVSYPGFATVDLSSANLQLNNDKFTVYVTGTNGGTVLLNSISVFTANNTTTPVIKTLPIEYDGSTLSFNLVSFTREIPEGASVSYRLYDKAGTDYTSYISVSNNIVTLNHVYGKLTVNNSIPRGTYILKASYGGQTFTSNVILEDVVLSGSGTSTSPYIIDTIPKLKKVSEKPGSYYKLTKDLDFAAYGGTFSSIDNFSGSFDGNGYTLSNFEVPIFNKIVGSSSGITTVKNLTLKNSNVSKNGITGALTNEIYDQGYSVKMSNINIIGGSVNSNSQSGALVGRVSVTGSNKISFNSIYSSASVSGNIASGLVGTLYNGTYGSNLYVNFSNIQVTGFNGTTSNSGYIIGGTQNVVPNISNFIVTGKMGTEGSDYHSVIGYYNNVDLIYKATIKDGYYAHGTVPFLSITTTYPSYTNNLAKKNPWDVTSVPGWSNASTYWTTKTVDGVSRMIVLKSAADKISYTKLNTLSVNINSQINIFNYLTPNIDAAKNIAISSSDTSIFTVDSYANIKGVKAGSAFLNIKSYYDGYSAKIPVSVLGNSTLTITFDANGGSGKMNNLIVNENISSILASNSYTRAGYTFKNWNTKADGTGTSYADGASVNTNKNLTLYAQWQPISYTIKFVTNGSNTIANISAKYDSTYNLSEGTKTGYIFDSWNTKADGTGTSYTTSAKNLTSTNGGTVTLYGFYKPITYTLKYDYNFNNLSTIKSFKYDTSYIADTPVYWQQKPFLGWNTKADGSGTNYMPGVTLKNLTTTNNGTVILYAQWGKNNAWSVKNYQFDSNNALLRNIINNTKVSDYIKNFTLSSGYLLATYNGTTKLDNSDLVGTGSITKVLYNGSVVSSMINVIRGDINGDGKVNSADYILIRKHIMDTAKITDIYYKEAADVSKDNNISSADYILIRKYIMNGGTL